VTDGIALIGYFALGAITIILGIYYDTLNVAGLFAAVIIFHKYYIQILKI
jgi:hypothetical protein